MHVGLRTGLNSVSPGVRFIKDQWTVGAYYNSRRRGSLYASYTLEKNPWALEVGLVTGYSGSPIIPFLRGRLELTEKVGLFVIPVPQSTREKKLDSVGWVLGIEYTF